MSKSKILVPIDFSEQSRSALEIAVPFAMINGGELLIAHVIEDDFEVYFKLGGVDKEGALEGLYEALHDFKPKNENVAFSHRLIDGKPAEAILKLADEENVELIVMGTHGRTGFKRLALGSVAEEVVRKAKCPVLTIRNPIESYEKEPMGIA